MTSEEREALRSLIDEAKRGKIDRTTCERCGDPFEQSGRPGPAKRFCSRDCQRRAARVRYATRRWADSHHFRELKRARKRRSDARRRARQAETAAVSIERTTA